MATPVEMPKLGNSVEECILAKWLKEPGAAVSAGETLAEIETDKATFEVTAPAAGTLLARFFEEGAVVPVYTVICVVGAEGEDLAPFTPGTAAAPASPPPAQAPAPAPGEARHEAPPAQAGAPMSPRARRFVQEHGVAAEGVRGSGPGGRVLEQDVRALHHTQARLSDAARARVQEGLRAPAEGSGPTGMVLSADLRATGSRLSGIREKIARRMRESLAGTAQYTLTASADARGLLAVRSRLKATLPELNINALVLFCTVKALERMPALNAELREGALTVHPHIHLGFAADTDRGLLVPVIRNAEKLKAAELAVQAKTLADQAVRGTISPDDLTGATFTVSNLGSLGIESFTPILSPPQVAILGVNTIELRPVRIEGTVALVDRIGLSLTCDHQVIDGAPGARFLRVLSDCIANVEALAGEGSGKERTCTTSS